MRDDLSRDLFPSDADRPDPLAAARAGARPALPKRFYEEAGIAERDGAFALTLDGRTARTPAGRLLAVPTRALGEALAAEWRAQGAEIDPAAMPLTRIVNSALDGVADNRAAVIEDIAKYAGSDLICYRAADPERLVAMQEAAWNPILDWAREALGARFVLSEGIVHVGQPESAVAAVRAAVAAAEAPFGLAGLHVMTTLTGSVLIALAEAGGGLTTDGAWAAAHVDERFQESVWGEDAEALARRAKRETEFRAAAAGCRLSASVDAIG